MNVRPVIPRHETKRFLLCAGDGTIDVGWITADRAEIIGHHPGPIRLQQGIPGPKGFGNLHVEAYPARIKQLGNLGFHTFAEFTSRVAKGFTRITEAGAVNRVGLIMPHQGYDLQLIVQYDREGFWSLKAGLPYRVARGRVLHVISRAGANPRRGCRQPPASRPYRCQKSLPTATGPNACGVLDLANRILGEQQSQNKDLFSRMPSPCQTEHYCRQSFVFLAAVNLLFIFGT